MLRLGVFLFVFLLAGVAFAQPAGEGARLWEQLSPSQRAEVWGRMDPEQRDRAWRRLPPEERAAIRERMSPQEREAMRNRFLERRNGGMPPERFAMPQRPGMDPDCRGEPGCMGPGARRGMPRMDGMEPRRLSPEERRQLREQIREANRDLPRRHGREERGR